MKRKMRTSNIQHRTPNVERRPAEAAERSAPPSFFLTRSVRTTFPRPTEGRTPTVMRQFTALLLRGRFCRGLFLGGLLLRLGLEAGLQLGRGVKLGGGKEIGGGLGFGAGSGWSGGRRRNDGLGHALGVAGRVDQEISGPE